MAISSAQNWTSSTERENREKWNEERKKEEETNIKNGNQVNERYLYICTRKTIILSIEIEVKRFRCRLRWATYIGNAISFAQLLHLCNWKSFRSFVHSCVRSLSCLNFVLFPIFIFAECAPRRRRRRRIVFCWRILFFSRFFLRKIKNNKLIVMTQSSGGGGEAQIWLAGRSVGMDRCWFREKLIQVPLLHRAHTHSKSTTTTATTSIVVG